LNTVDHKQHESVSKK